MDVAGFWTRSWINDDRLAVRQLLAPDVEVEWNLDAPIDDEELVRILHKIAVFADSVSVVSLPLSRMRSSISVAVAQKDVKSCCPRRQLVARSTASGSRE